MQASAAQPLIHIAQHLRVFPADVVQGSCWLPAGRSQQIITQLVAIRAETSADQPATYT